jgi:isfu1 transposase
LRQENKILAKTMPVPYSNDLRKKVIDLLEINKKSPKEVSLLLNIHPTTITRWHKRYREEGLYEFRGYNDNKDKIKIKDPTKIKKIIEESPFINCYEIAEMIDEDVTDVTILNYIRRLGLTFKKTPRYTKKGMKNLDLNS